MHILLREGVVTTNEAFERGEVVDWPDAEARRFIDRSIATEANEHEIAAAGRKVRKYNPPSPERKEASKLPARAMPIQKGAIVEENKGEE
jgi:hypothetical protein